MTVGKPYAKSVRIALPYVAPYELVEGTFVLDAEYSNPFDVRQVAADAVVSTPGGRQITVPCFAFQRYAEYELASWSVAEYELDQQITRPYEWGFRFSWSEPGEYTAYIVVDSRGGQARSETVCFSVEDGPGRPGPISVNPDNPMYFRRRRGGGDFLPVGYALPWSWTESYSNYVGNVRSLSENGGGFTRIWGAGTEQVAALETSLEGAGYYNMRSAAVQDLITGLMTGHDVSMQYSFDSFISLQTEAQWYGEWHDHPYNEDVGGFLQQPRDFFTDPRARALFQQRIRYTIARLGWNTDIVLWELINEIDGVTGFKGYEAEAAAWVEEMTAYVRDLDWHKRPIGVSFAKPEGIDVINRLSCLDFTTTHFYGHLDMAEQSRSLTRGLWERYRRPVVVGEFGPNAEDFDKAANGIYLQEGNWAALTSGAAIGAQSWWWDELIHTYSLTGQYRQLRKFVDRFDFGSTPLADLEAEAGHPDARVMGLSTDEVSRGMFWVQNVRNSSLRLYEDGRGGELSPPLPAFEVAVPAPAGRYAVWLWDTWRDSEPEMMHVQADDGCLRVTFGRLEKDAAVQFRRLPAGE